MVPLVARCSSWFVVLGVGKSCHRKKRHLCLSHGPPFHSGAPSHGVSNTRNHENPTPSLDLKTSTSPCPAIHHKAYVQHRRERTADRNVERDGRGAKKKKARRWLRNSMNRAEKSPAKFRCPLLSAANQATDLRPPVRALKHTYIHAKTLFFFF